MSGQLGSVGKRWSNVPFRRRFLTGSALLHPLDVSVVRCFDHPVRDVATGIFWWIFGALVEPTFLFAMTVGEGKHGGIVVVHAGVILPKPVHLRFVWPTIHIDAVVAGIDAVPPHIE